MSRIGLKPVAIPNDVKVSKNDSEFIVEGPKGKLKQKYHKAIDISINDKVITFNRENDLKCNKSLHGLYRNLMQNMITGVTKGFQKTLVINGVGYRVESKGKALLLNLGYSTPIEYYPPENISVQCDGNVKLIVSGIDNQLVGKVCSEIRMLRPPEPYKGKGIKYETETLRRKVGKTGIK